MNEFRLVSSASPGANTLVVETGYGIGDEAYHRYRRVNGFPLARAQVIAGQEAVASVLVTESNGDGVVAETSSTVE